MNKLRLSLVFAFVAFSGLTAQEVETTEVQGPKINTINQQFEDLYNDSNSWEDYKNIKKGDFIKLQKNAVDSISNLKTEIASLQANIDSQKSEVNQLNDSLVETKSTLASTIEEKDSIFFFGIPMSKVGYMTMMWAIVGVLALGLVLFIYKYKGSNAHTQEARKKLNET